MSTSQNIDTIQQYMQAVTQQFLSGHAREHAYRPALERLMSSYPDVRAVNDPARSANGNPDFVFLKASNTDIILGYAEAKDITVDVDKTLKTEQLRRYAGYEKLFLTNYLDFVFLQNGTEYQRISIGKIVNNTIVPHQSQFERLANELQAYFNLPPEQIKSGKKLSIIMGGKARRIRDNVAQYLQAEGHASNAELEKMYALMQQTLVHDLTKDAFADMYAQTLVYGLFAARYNDTTPDDFSRREAVETVPKSNPFLRKFFDHIAGADFDPRLGYIVDELCDVFRVSDVNTLVHKHLRLFELGDEKDPIIHFYEDFLKEYDPAERKRMGAYYTPLPVVRYIVRHVDAILKDDFGIAKGLADTQMTDYVVDQGQALQIRDPKTGKLTKTTKQTKTVHRVQVLDPAVGTATFLNEVILHIRSSFAGQEGLWPAYVNDHLLPRLHGFELMMAPYTVAHLKLGITLQETGATNITERLGVYLTNTLEEGVPKQQDLFTFGLAGAVTEESQKASQIKHERPIMIVMGNPPYSVSSNNKSEYIEKLVKDYKKDLNERNIQPLSDDYIKFIRFAEEMVAKNGEGIVAMITNNSYIDGIIHRQMRKHLLETFDKLYILDLHGNSKKKETAPDGGKDENVFDIQQGVAIILAVKAGKKQAKLASVHHMNIYGKRADKFSQLGAVLWHFTHIEPTAPNYFFVQKDNKIQAEYEKFVSVRALMPFGDAGIKTHRDNFAVGFTKAEVFERLVALRDGTRTPVELGLKDTRDFSIDKAREHLQTLSDEQLLAGIRPVMYRPFDNRNIFYSDKVIDWPRWKTMKHLLDTENFTINITRSNRAMSQGYVLANSGMTDVHLLDSSADSMYVVPLWLYHDYGTKTANFDDAVLKDLLSEIGPYTYTPERSDRQTPPEDFWVTAIDVFDYIYGVLHSPKYRETYKEFLKIDFPRVPKPQSPTEVAHFALLGRELRQLHLLQDPDLDTVSTTYSVAGDNVVEKVAFVSGVDTPTGSVYINATQYFGNVPLVAWNMYIGGYQPAQKWLKDRRGRTLSSDELMHYQKIIKALERTNHWMQELDTHHDH